MFYDARNFKLGSTAHMYKSPTCIVIFALEDIPCVGRTIYLYTLTYPYKISYKQKINVSYARNISVNAWIYF